MATRLLPHFPPARLEPEELLEWGLDSWTPPYISSTPAIRHHEVLPGDMFLFASDGLQDGLRVPNAQKFDIILSWRMGSMTSALRERLAMHAPQLGKATTWPGG
jgi:serine/threonine protein phosphatase PrpC